MTETQKGLQEVLGHFETAMLCTRLADGTIRARPMAIARCDDRGDVWFVTSIGSGKVEELLKDAAVVVTLQSKARYLSLSGHAEIVGDEEKIAELWRPAWRAWFPEGERDPRLVLVHVIANEAEYWNESATHGVRYVFRAAKAVLKGERPGTGEDHGHIVM